MRTLSTFISPHPKAKVFLDKLADRSTSSQEYRKSFHELGKTLGEVLIKDKNIHGKKILLCCTNEDADWLGSGLLEVISTINNVSLTVLWNYRHTPGNDSNLTVAPVVKSYIEPLDKCDILIICKSIIFNSCVVRSNIQHLFDKVCPTNTVIVSPVIFKGAEDKLKREFPKRISDSFDFVYLAKDDESNDKGEVIPGIGGAIYDRIGLNGFANKNSYIPDIVKRRRLAIHQ